MADTIEMRCIDCRWCQQRGMGSAHRCVRYAPTDHYKECTAGAIWPVVEPYHHYCGEWSPLPGVLVKCRAGNDEAATNEED